MTEHDAKLINSLRSPDPDCANWDWLKWRLPDSKLAAFDRWMDERIGSLESDFRHLETINSRRRALRQELRRSGR